MTPEFDKLQVKKQLEDAHQEIAESLGLWDQVCIEQVADAMDQVQAAEARELAISNLDRAARRLRDRRSPAQIGRWRVRHLCELRRADRAQTAPRGSLGATLPEVPGDG
jgi:hypothetical protein